MQNYQYCRPPGPGGAYGVGNGQNQGDLYAVPTHNRFAPLPPVAEWVGYSMNLGVDSEPMYLDIMPNKRRRFNTGDGQSDISNSNLDSKLSFICDKLDNLERANQSIAAIAQNLNTVQSKVMCIESQNIEQSRFLKVLAYKSIDIEARSRRKNLVFHGLAESRSEDCYRVLRDFLWSEMSLDIEDLGIERLHRLGSLHNAKLKSDPPRRPIIAAFYEYRHTNIVLDAAYMLKATNFSVSRDYPKEILSARKRLIPRFKLERQNKNKVSIEYPAKLVVNGRVIADEFPDWYIMLSQDRCKLANGEPFVDPVQQRQQQQQSCQQNMLQQQQQQQQQQQDYDRQQFILEQQRQQLIRQEEQLSQRRKQQEQQCQEQQQQPPPVRTYAEVVSSNNEERTSGQAQINIPRYTTLNTGNQNPFIASTMACTTTTFSTITVTTSHSSVTQNIYTGVGSNGTGSREQLTYTKL